MWRFIHILKKAEIFHLKIKLLVVLFLLPVILQKGMEKEYIKENIRFLEIAKGSTAELITQIYIGIEINYIDKTKGFKWVKETNELLKMLNGLKKSLTIKDTK